MTRHPRSRRPAQQRGGSLIQSLIAFAVLGLALAAAARLQGFVRLEADISRQRSEAVRLAQQEIEQMRSFSTLRATPGAQAYDEIVAATRALAAGTAQRRNTGFELVRSVEPMAGLAARSAAVEVTWSDRSGQPQQLRLQSIIGGADPLHSGALALVPSELVARGAYARSPLVPLEARDLGDGRSALKPTHQATEAWVFDNRSGVVSSRCIGIAAARSTHDLVLADLSTCVPMAAVMLSGVIRFSAAQPPQIAGAADAPLPASVAIDLAGGPYGQPARCESEARMTVVASGAGGPVLVDVPLGATPASLGFTGWAASGDRFMAYACLVTVATDWRWSGRSRVVPSGWAIGTAASQWRVCRITADADRSGAIDANLEHPADYAGVRENLPQQNFLVVRGDLGCPGADAVTLASAPHQP
jgi:Tfp pilus assembly protein PilV